MNANLFTNIDTRLGYGKDCKHHRRCALWVLFLHAFLPSKLVINFAQCARFHVRNS